MERLQSAMILKTPLHDPTTADIIEHRSDAFYLTIYNDDADALRQMVREGFDVDYHAFGRYPPLIEAIRYKRMRIMQTLLICGADPDVCDREGVPALHYAIKSGDKSAVHQMLRYGAQIRYQSHDALKLAATIPDAALTVLLKETVSMFDKDPETDLYKLAGRGDLHALIHLHPSSETLLQTDDRGRSLLHHAVLSNNLKLVIYLLNKSLDVDGTDRYAISPIIVAASHPRLIEVLTLLIERGATLEHHTNNGATALTIALQNGNADGAALLISEGASLFTVDGLHTPLTLVHHAIHKFPEQSGPFRQLQTIMLDKGAHVDVITNKSGWTPLFQAAARQQDQSMLAHMSLLIQLGADINTVDRNGRTPLLVAASMGRVSAMRLLISNYADVDHVDRHGWTALMLAIYYNHQKAVKFLLENGCDVNLVTEQRLSAMSVATKHNRAELITMLRDFGAVEPDKRTEEEE